MASLRPIDDDPRFRATLEQLLIDRGHAVATADGSEAPKLLHAEPFAPAIIDLVRPNRAGRETILTLWAAPLPDLIISDLPLEDFAGLAMIEQWMAKLPHTPVILLTDVLLDPPVFRETLSQRISAYLREASSFFRIREEIERQTPGLSESTPSHIGQK